MSQDYSSPQVCRVTHCISVWPFSLWATSNCPTSTSRLWVCRITQKLPFAATAPPSSRMKTERKQFCGRESYLPSEDTIHLKSRESIINISHKIFLLNTKMHPWTVKKVCLSDQHFQITKSAQPRLQLWSAPHSESLHPTATRAQPRSHSKRGHLGQQRRCCLGQLLSTSPNHLPLPAVLEVTVPQWGYLTE